MPYAFVTGTARGIGKALADELARRKFNLLLVDIAGDELEQHAQALRKKYGVDVQTLTLDLARTDAAPTILAWVAPYAADLTVVVNNAGFGLNGPFEAVSLEEHFELFNVNVRALVALSHGFIPLLRRHPKAWLLNVGSTTCYQSVPYLSTYAASKALVFSFTRSLRHELRRSPISVSVLSPGSTDTHFVDRARMGESVRRTAARVHMTPESVARTAIDGLFAGKAEIIPGFLNQLNAILPRIFPRAWVERVAGSIYEPKVAAKPPVAAEPVPRYETSEPAAS